jgi:hypothetical protein
VDEFPGRPPRDEQPWAWAAAVAAALVILAVGAIVGMTTSGGGSSAAAGSTATAATAAGASEPGIPPTVTVPEATGTGGTGPGTETALPGGATTGAATPTLPTVPATTAPGATTGPAFPGFESWPEGKDGYTVVLASVAQSKGEAAVLAKAQKAKNAGLPQVGVLSSSEYSTLKAGFWVVFSGVYDSLGQAAAGVADARAAGFPDAYPRNVAP